MSLVTDLVFIIPDGIGLAREAAERFEASFHEAHGWNIHPQEGAGKVPGCSVYFAGVNYINLGWVDAILADQWPEGAVLWLHPEEDGMDVGQPAVHRLGPKEQR